MITQNITLYCKKYSVPPVVHAVQNDTNREVAALLGDLTLTGSMTAELSVFRSDGTHYDGTATINTGTNTVTAEIDQALTQAGKQRCQIKVTESDGTGSTFIFIIDAQPDTSGVSVEQDGWSAQKIMDDIEALETGKQDKLTAGDGISIEDATISVDSDDTLTSETKPAQAAAVGEALEAMDYSKAPVIVDTTDGPIASFPDGADNYPMRSVVADINPVQAGTGDPSPDNVRPITGHTEVNIQQTGKNILPMPITSGSYDNNVSITVNEDKSFYISKPSSSGWTSIYLAQNYLLKAGTYSLIEDDDNNTNTAINIYKAGTTTSVTNTRYNKNRSFTLDADELVDINYSRAGEASNVLTKLMLFIGGTHTADEYIPFNSNIYEILLGRTVYGGTLDAIIGKLMDNMSSVDMGTLSWEKDTTSLNYPVFKTAFGQDPPGRKPGSTNFLCSNYKNTEDSRGSLNTNNNSMATWNTSNSGIVAVRDDSLSSLTADQFKTAMNGVQLVYELATPIEYDLTPEEIRSLLGTNNIWHDANGDTEATYCADTKRYIQKVISQLA